MHRWRTWVYTVLSGAAMAAILALLHKSRQWTGLEETHVLESLSARDTTDIYSISTAVKQVDSTPRGTGFPRLTGTGTGPPRFTSDSFKGSPASGSKYPEWWEHAWPRSAVTSLLDVFVGDQPLFPACQLDPPQTKLYSYVDPPEYLARSKNPCWYAKEASDKGLRCAPYFYLAGVAKGGTTDLFRRIRLHPDVMFGTLKEYHWWDRNRYGHSSKDPLGNVKVSGGMPLRDYLAKITGSELRQVAAELKDGGTSVKIFGDGSPSYLWDSFYWVALDGNQGCTEPRVITGHHIRHFYPDAKIILTFRHPTPRLYSRFLSRIPRTPELRKSTSKDFHKLVMRAIRLYKECYKDWSIRHCTYNHSLYQDAIVRLVEGMYPVFMADWLRIWPKEQMLILRYEDYSNNTETILRKVFDFLGLAPLNRTQWDVVMEIEKFNVGTDMYEKVGKMLPETKAALDEFHQPFIYKFAELMQDNRFLWADTDH